MTEAPRLQVNVATFPADLARAAPAYLRWARSRVRESELWLLVVAIAIGAAAGLTTHVLSQISSLMHDLLFGVRMGEKLSSEPHIEPLRLLWLPAGGLLLGGVNWLWRRTRPRPIVDPVEANALRGGRMSFRDSLFLSLQTLISNGFGASVGLEAAYAQLGAGTASSAGLRLNARRNDLRTLVGAGAGAAIAGAFGAPFTGAFYAFELIVGSYTVANAVPIVAASWAGYLVAQTLGGSPHIVDPTETSLKAVDYIVCAALGVLAAAVGVAIMRLVNLVEVTTNKFIPRLVQPAIAGVIAAGFALITPEVLASGHGALERHLAHPIDIEPLIIIFALKALASIVCLGMGFRGGLFFASLFLGALLGQIFWTGLALTGVQGLPDVLVCSLVGMSALAAGIVGGPLTMSFLVLETTGDWPLAGATLAASLICSLVVREYFGFSFSTWRFHLRGETIRSAHDVGRIRSLTAGKMMRPNPPSIAASATVEEFRRRFPLGSTSRAILLDEQGRYAGIALTADVYAEQRDLKAPLSALAKRKGVALTPETNVQDAMAAFQASGGDELAVVDADGSVLGLITEGYAARRYAEELEKTRQDLVGET